MPSPTVSVAIPTRHRAAYLRVALESVLPQARAEGADVLVVVDGPDPDSERVAAGLGARVVVHDEPRGLNAARNTAIANTTGELIAFVDDDVRVHPGWLAALRDAAAREPDVDCFTGPIVARIEDHRFPMCGREGPPVTFLDLGDADADAPHAWGANMTIRRRAIDRVGPFDEARELYGDEQEWQDRLRASDRPRIRYVAAAGLDHRRAGDDARLRSLMRAARARGRASRRFDVHRGTAPSLAAELRVLAGCLWHGPRRRCLNGPVMAAHSVGRLEAALRPQPDPSAPDFLAGASGTVGGRRGTLRRAADRVLDVLALPARARLAAAARRTPRRRVLALAVVRDEHRGRFARVEAALRASRHDVELATTAPGGRGKFENLNALLAAHPAAGRDWLLVVDDDVELPPRFLDELIAAAERFDLALAQPAHRLHSHAAWSVTRRRPAALARRTAFVEIGPVTLVAARAFGDLLPFPPLRMGWGLDVHWAALAQQRGWRLGVVDAVPVLHAAAPAAAAYSRAQAIAEARALLADRPYLPRDAANRTLRTWR
ncbi:MAG: glycosyltransferase family 2 protein [Solirubrobacteraceae bacterium]|nr:glycosyltransferase family 2 protein [Solirubrobacteraceae bacterium]